MILTWETPKKRLTTEQWQNISADSAPPGVYTPNMSAEDNKAWKAKYRSKLGQVEIRRDGLVIVVSLDGYSYKSHQTGIHMQSRWGCKRARIHVASNGPLMYTLQDFDNMVQAVNEAKAFLTIAKDDPKKAKDALKQGNPGVESLLVGEAA